MPPGADEDIEPGVDDKTPQHHANARIQGAATAAVLNDEANKPIESGGR